MHTIYKGSRTQDGCAITANGKPLDPRHDLRNHSPDGFEWGYEGSGPAQTALAILTHEIGQHRALKIYQDFKRAVVAGLKSEWELDSEAIQACARTIEIWKQP